MGSPELGRLRDGWGKTAADTVKVTIMTKVAYELSIDTKIDDLELLWSQILLEFCVISRLWEATTAKQMKIDSVSATKL